MAENISGGGYVIGLAEMEMEEEEELFEINLEAVYEIPPPEYLWESLVKATGEALLANCLLPVSHLSSAVPVSSNKLSYEVAPVLATLSGILMVKGMESLDAQLPSLNY